MEKVTIYDIAKKVGTSPTTVSRALNGKGEFSDEMRATIIKVAKEMNYAPNLAAKSLKTQYSYQIMLVVPDIQDLFYLKMIKAVQEYALLQGYSMLIQDARSQYDEEIKVLEGINNSFVDGLILVSLDLTQKHLDAVAQSGKPVVLCSTSNDNLSHVTRYCDFVGVDSYLAVQLALRHLISQGHKEIGFVGFLHDTFPGHERLQAYLDTMKSYGLEVNKKNIFDGPLDSNFGYRTGLYLSKSKKRPTAVLCTTDFITPGLYKALGESGIRIPQDIALASLDNIYIDQYMVPAITSVELFQDKMGRRSAQMLFERIFGEGKKYRKTILKPELVVRSSSIIQDDL